MNDGLTIRGAEAADAPALAALLERLGYPAAPDAIAVRLARLVGAGDEAFVAVVAGEVVGLVTLHVTQVLHRPAPVGRITGLVVAEAATRGGVGRALVGWAEARLADRGCGFVEVTSGLARSDAHRFYERLGYRNDDLRFFKVLG